MRRLTISFHVTVANYEYLVYWRLYQDGNIECEIRATGIMVTTPWRRRTAASERHPRRRTHVCAVPPTLSGGPAGHGRRRRRQHGLHVGVLSRADRGRTTRTASPWCSRQRAAAHRGRRQAGLTSRPSGVEGGEHQRRQRARAPGRVQAGARRRFPPMMDPASPVFERARRHRPHTVGDAETIPTNVGPRANSSTRPRGHRPPRVDGAEPPHREHRRRAVVRVRHPPHHPPGGLAGDAGRRGVVLAQAVRLLRPQPRARRVSPGGRPPGTPACAPRPRGGTSPTHRPLTGHRARFAGPVSSASP